MTEIAGKGTSGTCDRDNTGFDLELNTVLLDIKVGRLENGGAAFATMINSRACKAQIFRN